MKKKICFISVRYGLEVNGGAELHCRQLAEHMAKNFDVDIFTTKAKDYITWENEYPNDIDIVNGLTVYRFPVEKERNIKEFVKYNNYFDSEIKGNLENEQRWVEMQGPYCPKLLEKLEEVKDDYDAFIFFTYLYYPTIMGIPVVKEKSILIPTAHEEPTIHMTILKQVFNEAGGIFYNTSIEREMVQSYFHNEYVYNDLGGVGVELPESIDPSRVRNKYNLQDYIIYVGRIDLAKGCDTLFEYFQTYKKNNDNNLKLVLAGKPVIPIPNDGNIISLGFVDDQDKFDLIAGAKALVLPSEFESLSMVVLEAMKVHTPVLVNGNCSVVKRHCLISNAGLYYQSYEEFEGMLNWMLAHEEECKIIGENGEKYVNENYTWDIIVERLSHLIDYIN